MGCSSNLVIRYVCLEWWSGIIIRERWLGYIYLVNYNIGGVDKLKFRGMVVERYSGKICLFYKNKDMSLNFKILCKVGYSSCL